jgi:hypothetical protein
MEKTNLAVTRWSTTVDGSLEVDLEQQSPNQDHWGELHMNATSPSALGSLGNIFFEPKRTLNDIRGHNSWLWYPLVIGIVAFTAYTVWYYLTVDFGWMVDQMLASLPPEKAQAARGTMSRGVYVISSVVGIPIVVLVINAVQALYFFFVSKVSGYEEQSFASWFSFVCWTAFPSVLGVVASCVMYLFSSKQVMSTTLDVTSLNTLLFHVPMGGAWFALLSSLHLTTIWSLWLMVVGFSLWTKQTAGKSTVIVLAPYVVIYGLWILIKLI